MFTLLLCLLEFTLESQFQFYILYIVDGTFVCTYHCNYIILYKNIMIFVVRTLNSLSPRFID